MVSDLLVPDVYLTKPLYDFDNKRKTKTQGVIVIWVNKKQSNC